MEKARVRFKIWQDGNVVGKCSFVTYYGVEFWSILVEKIQKKFGDEFKDINLPGKTIILH